MRAERIVRPSIPQREGDESENMLGIKKKTARQGERERQHMHWQCYKLQLDEEDVCLYAIICLLPKPNKETEWRVSGHHSISLRALTSSHSIIFYRLDCSYITDPSNLQLFSKLSG